MDMAEDEDRPDPNKSTGRQSKDSRDPKYRRPGYGGPSGRDILAQDLDITEAAAEYERQKAALAAMRRVERTFAGIGRWTRTEAKSVPLPSALRHLTFGEVLAILVAMVLTALSIIAFFIWPLEIAGGLLFAAWIVTLYGIWLFKLPLLKPPRFAWLCGLTIVPIALLCFRGLPIWVLAIRGDSGSLPTANVVPQTALSAQLITPSPSPGPPDITFLNAGTSYNANYYAVEPTLFVKNQGGAVQIRSGISQHIGNFLNNPILQFQRVRRVFNEAKKNVSGNWYTFQGGTGYRIPLPAGHISSSQYGQLESQKAEYTWGVYIVAKNDQWIRHFFFCGINAGPQTTTAVCPVVGGSNGNGP